MKKAGNDDRSLVVDLLTESFKDNLGINFIVKQDRRKLKRVRAVMEHAFDTSFRFGECWLSDDRNACALILFPHLNQSNFYAMWLYIKLVFKGTGIAGARMAAQLGKQIKAVQPDEQMVYLSFIGVAPNLQGQGIGSKMLSEMIELAHKKSLPVFLETSTLVNIPWYEKFGFEIYQKLELNYPLYFFKRVHSTT